VWWPVAIWVEHEHPRGLPMLDYRARCVEKRRCALSNTTHSLSWAAFETSQPGCPTDVFGSYPDQSSLCPSRPSLWPTHSAIVGWFSVGQRDRKCEQVCWEVLVVC
jgi:hypothetical protein